MVISNHVGRVAGLLINYSRPLTGRLKFAAVAVLAAITLAANAKDAQHSAALLHLLLVNNADDCSLDRVISLGRGRVQFRLITVDLRAAGLVRTAWHLGTDDCLVVLNDTVNPQGNAAPNQTGYEANPRNLRPKPVAKRFLIAHFSFLQISYH